MRKDMKFGTRSKKGAGTGGGVEVRGQMNRLA